MGFASPAQDYTETRLSLDDLFIKRPAATYFIRSSVGYPHIGIMPDSLLVVDSSGRVRCDCKRRGGVSDIRFADVPRPDAD